MIKETILKEDDTAKRMISPFLLGFSLLYHLTAKKKYFNTKQLEKKITR